jgi:low affinity Fe/Cu permease
MPTYHEGNMTEELLAEVEAEHEKWADPEKAWTIMHEAEEKVFFHTLEIAKDGGLDEIGVKEELWYKTRPISAAVLLLFVVYNVYYLLLVDLTILLTSDEKKKEQEFLVTAEILKILHTGFAVKRASSFLAALELAFLSGWIIMAFVQVYLIKSRDGLKKWQAVKFLCWDCIPQLSNFSAMKLLAFISPSKLSVDLFDILFYRESGVARSLIVFIITRPLMVVLGIDTFLIKFRLAAQFVLNTKFSVGYFLGAFIFLNQILGALNLARELKFRLYRFVFGGEDGIITDEESNIQTVWETMVIERIFEKYTKWQACALLLTWNDDDFQLLTLNQVNFKIGE